MNELYHLLGMQESSTCCLSGHAVDSVEHALCERDSYWKTRVIISGKLGLAGNEDIASEKKLLRP